MFELRVKDGVPACIYKPSPDIFFTLDYAGVLTPSMIALDYSNPITLDMLPIGFKTAYQNLLTDYDAKSAEAIGKLEKTARIQDLFKDMQAKENVSDKAPDAYQQARIAYYTAVNGDNWIETEKQRIAKSEADPKINQYLSAYQDMSGRLGQQQQTYDIIKGEKDKMLSMKNDFQFTTKAFNKQIDELKSQINIERNNHTLEKEKNFSWLNALLNILIIIVTITIIVLLIRKIWRRNQTYTTDYSYY